MKKIGYLALAAVFFVSSGFVDMMSDCVSDGETLYSIEDGIADIANAKKLDISMNKLKSIDPKIGQLTNLECLDLSFNTFTTLPAELAQLQNLKYLNISGTRYLAKVPDVVYQLPALEILDITDHPEWSKDKFEEAKKKLPKVRVITTQEASGPVELD